MLPSGSLPAPAKATVAPLATERSAAGAVMVAVGGLLPEATTVTTRVAGVGSARPLASVTVSDTVNVPAVLNTTVGLCAVLLVAPPPKFQA